MTRAFGCCTWILGAGPLADHGVRVSGPGLGKVFAEGRTIFANAARARTLSAITCMAAVKEIAEKFRAHC